MSHLQPQPKGSIAVGSTVGAAGSVTPLLVGADGTVLTADSTTPTGLKYAVGGGALTTGYTTATGPVNILSSATQTDLISLTPAAGDYLVWASCWLTNITAGITGQVIVRLAIDATGVTDSEKATSEPVTATVKVPISTMARVTVNGAQAIIFQGIKSGANAPTAHNIELMILKIT